MTSKIAIAQVAPVILNREKTLERAIELIEEAAANGAKLLVFPEAFISGYPAWIWRLRPGSDWSTSEELHGQLQDSAVDLHAEGLKTICEAARKNQLNLVCPLNEKETQRSGATVYNSVLTIGESGEILNHHRKLMPTNPERMVWGFGDGSGLNVVDTSVGKIGTLLCWENYMPLARYALYAQGIEIYVAPTYDSGEGWIGSMQHIAREGRCWVICAGVALTRSDIPEDFPQRDTLYPEGNEWINPGDSLVVAPGGEIIAGPMHEEKGLLYAEVDASLSSRAKRALDVAGHYSRPDIFTLKVNRKSQSPIEFD